MITDVYDRRITNDRSREKMNIASIEEQKKEENDLSHPLKVDYL